MTKDKTLTLTKQYLLYALLYLLFFISNLIPLWVQPTGWLQHVNSISLFAFIVLIIYFSVFKNFEGEDELSRTNLLKANSFSFNASLISLLVLLFLLKFLSNHGFSLPEMPYLLIPYFWFILFVRNIMFLYYEKRENA